MTSGATEAIFNAIHAVVRPGEEVIVLDPCYDCYEPAIDLAGAIPVHVPLDPVDFSVDWQRVRGTPASVDMALSWIGYSGEIEEPSVRRQRWNLFQLMLDRVRDSEADLGRIEGVTQLSVPVRSYI